MSALEQAIEFLTPQVGGELGVSDWITVDQQMIDDFARTTRDMQWIHVDPARAATDSPFGGTIAHGFLTLSLASRFFYDCQVDLPGQAMGINYGFNKLRFLAPVPAGSRLRGRFELTGIKPKPSGKLLREMRLTIEIAGQNTPALIAEWLGMVVFTDAG
ncbi:MaoC family dehydratase [Primorskyibacter sp. S87]|uniref:MaoC family dehydratase n=1 Tax=Primorskyibacter sp. S87 TaxID=3415126 RepID=UPI003C7D1860